MKRFRFNINGTRSTSELQTMFDEFRDFIVWSKHNCTSAHYAMIDVDFTMLILKHAHLISEIIFVDETGNREEGTLSHGVHSQEFTSMRNPLPPPNYIMTDYINN